MSKESPPPDKLTVFIRSCFRQNKDDDAQFFSNVIDAARCMESVFNPESASIILLTDLDYRNPYRSILHQKDLMPFLDKVVCHTESARPPIFVRGIYTASLVTDQRTLPGVYFNYLNRIDEMFDAESSAPPKRDIAFSFMGRSCNSLRKRILKSGKLSGFRESHIEDTTNSFPIFSNDKQKIDSNQRRKYLNVLSRSVFVLCPRGTGSNSIRTFEALKAGAVPVVLSDDIEMPAAEGVDEYYLHVPEKDINSIPDILQQNLPRAATLQANGKQAWQYFASNQFWVDSLKKLDAMVEEGEITNAPITILRLCSGFREFVRLPLRLRHSLIQSKKK